MCFFELITDACVQSDASISADTGAAAETVRLIDMIDYHSRCGQIFENKCPGVFIHCVDVSDSAEEVT